MKISARNILKGKVIEVSEGAVNTEVLLELTGGAKVVSIISKESAKKTRFEIRQKSICDYKSFQCNDGC
jgi:molybdopterin-binding protein